LLWLLKALAIALFGHAPRDKGEYFHFKGNETICDGFDSVVLLLRQAIVLRDYARRTSRPNDRPHRFDNLISTAMNPEAAANAPARTRFEAADDPAKAIKVRFWALQLSTGANGRLGSWLCENVLALTLCHWGKASLVRATHHSTGGGWVMGHMRASRRLIAESRELLELIDRLLASSTLKPLDTASREYR
jgi:hypothetical protein